MRAAVELVNDLEYCLLAFRRRSVRSQKHPNAQMRRGPQLLRNHGIGCFLHAIVQESIGIVRAEDKSGPYCFPKVLVKFLDRLLVSHRQHVELGAVSHAGELLECLLCLDWQAVQLSDHEFHDIVGVAFGVNAIQVPYPAAFTVVEAEQAFLSQRGNELDGEEGIARGLLMNQFRERSGASRLAVQRVRQQLTQIVLTERCQNDVLHCRSGLTDRIEFAHQAGAWR